jgi:hypothetical protein
MNVPPAAPLPKVASTAALLSMSSTNAATGHSALAPQGESRT